jgi:phosphotransferase system HPr (HPr) family protein
MQATGGEVLRRKLTITAPDGLHLRPAAALAETAARFVSTVVVWLGDRRADAKSPLALMLLAADRGVELDLEIRGQDAREAMEALAGLLTGSSWAAPVDDPAAG